MTTDKFIILELKRSENFSWRKISIIGWMKKYAVKIHMQIPSGGIRGFLT